eukprot:gnl/MRDRNA2_/MRDRNA2_76296_c0_seq4.p1 gnl/MRDRNA2_/MRDRNA2_76296_c0~~gnl/MRDRNA2_/MRDRNA2_76296_c0_seq4.p1  ORF type:complete len:576 (+),score=82.49 gnl/MRDRNA2_/MRDRNA2_76296_c0_seq4:87-1814(+)
MRSLTLGHTQPCHWQPATFARWGPAAVARVEEMWFLELALSSSLVADNTAHHLQEAHGQESPWGFLEVDWILIVQSYSCSKCCAYHVAAADAAARSSYKTAAAATSSDTLTYPQTTEEITDQNPLRVIIAGAGVGGLALANSLRKDPKMQVTVLEKTDEFKRFGGPIQLASNALQVIKEMDEGIFNKIIEKFTFTGNLKNGIKDGIRTEWFIPFDLASPAEARNMTYTGVIERPDLQEIWLNALPKGIVRNGDGVARYETNPNGHGVKAIMESGAVVDGDVLIGADGIWSTVRATMWDKPVKGEGSGVSYSGYTCFAGELPYDSPDNGEVGYKVYIGPGQYFVVSDIGNGRYQWYAFLARKPGSAESEPKPKGQVQYLKNVFKGWSPELHHILDATKENQIGQRDLYDLPPPVLKPWTAGPAALLGDSVHAMMPNLGQGGCQAIEDAFVISQELKSIQTRGEIPTKLKRYVDRRQIRSAAVHGLSRLASDLVINTFGTPVKVTFEGGLKVENFDYLGVITRCWQPILPQFFKVQWGFLYECWRNEFAIDLNVALGLLLVTILLDPLGLVPFVGIN